MNRRLFIGNLDYRAHENDLKEAFNGLGFEPTDVKILYDKATGQSRGFGFVELATEAEAMEAINTMNGVGVRGRAIVVKEAERRPQEGYSRPGSRDRSGQNGERPRDSHDWVRRRNDVR